MYREIECHINKKSPMAGACGKKFAMKRNKTNVNILLNHKIISSEQKFACHV